MEYQLKIRQVVEYQRCRIYREFIRNLMEDRNIRTNGGSYLFYFMVLYSFVNFRTSYQKVEGISYTVGPGEWICRPSDLAEWFRTRFQHQAIGILEDLQKQNYITFSKVGREGLIKYKINEWKSANTHLEYNYPCQKDTGFFFFPIAMVNELVSVGKCSEMDVVLDLWIHAIYQDESVQGSDVGPVVYFRNGTGNPRCNYAYMAGRWGNSKATVSRILKKLEEKDYITLVAFSGTHGSVIYLKNYLSTMFQVSDVLIDKEEISMAFQIPVQIPSEDAEKFDIQEEQILLEEDENSVSNEGNSVSKSHILFMVRKVAETLAVQGVSCCECKETIYKLYRLSDCKSEYYRYLLKIHCPYLKEQYKFELTIKRVEVRRTKSEFKEKSNE